MHIYGNAIRELIGKYDKMVKVQRAPISKLRPGSTIREEYVTYNKENIVLKGDLIPRRTVEETALYEEV